MYEKVNKGRKSYSYFHDIPKPYCEVTYYKIVHLDSSLPNNMYFGMILNWTIRAFFVCYFIVVATDWNKERVWMSKTC